MIHRGIILEKIARTSGIAFTEIARRIGYERTAIYQHFKRSDLDYGIILQYGKALNHDFSVDFPEMLEYVSSIQEPLEKYESSTLSEVLRDRDYWKDKYIKLLEKHTDMLAMHLNNELNRKI